MSAPRRPAPEDIQAFAEAVARLARVQAAAELRQLRAMTKVIDAIADALEEAHDE